MNMCSLISCRLCLYNSSDYFDLNSEKSQQKNLKEIILKYLDLDLPENDPFSKNVCVKCSERVEQFDEFSKLVQSNQEILKLTQPPIIIANETGKYLVTLQNTNVIPSVSIELGDFVVVDNNSPSASIEHFSCPPQNQINENCMEVILVPANNNEGLLNNLQNEETVVKEEQNILNTEINLNKNEHIVPKNVIVEKRPLTKKSSKKPTKRLPKQKSVKDMKIKTESPIEIVENDAKLKIDIDLIDQYDEDSDGEDNDDIIDDDAQFIDDEDDILQNVYEKDESFAGFPKILIKNTKLLVRGAKLCDLMSRFYRLECDLCPNNTNSNDRFEDILVLHQHYKNIHSIKGYVVCCGIKLIKSRALALHMARHLQPDAFTCSICDKQMTCPKILQYHMQNHLPEDQRPLACPDCPRRFSYSSALVAHAISHLPEDERAAHVCDDCGKSFSSPGRLSTHINVAHISHAQDYICHICAKQFSNRGNLNYHFTTHQPRVHQMQCEQCGKWLKNKLCLRKHMVQHSAVQFSCNLCDYSSVNRQCLRNHIKVQHSDDKPFVCQYCSKTFKLRNNLLNHMVQHTGVRKYTCEFCNRTFASSGNYYSHRKRMHPNELSAVREKKEEEERQLRATVFGKKIKSEEQ